MIKVLFFAGLREALGCAEFEMTLDRPQSVSAIKKSLGEKLAGAETLLNQDNILCALNQEMVKPETVVSDGDELAFFPPVTGG